MKINKIIKENLKKYLDQLIKNDKEKVTLISAAPLRDTELELLFNYIPRLKNATLNYAIDKNIIAGVVIKIGSKVIDLSLSGKLNNLKNLIYELN